MTLYERYMLIQHEERVKAWDWAIRNPWLWVWTFGWVIGLIVFLALSACSSPAVRVQYIETKTYIPIPATLTAPVSIVLPQGVTWGNALADTRAGLDTCNGQLKAIKGLVPPY